MKSRENSRFSCFPEILRNLLMCVYVDAGSALKCTLEGSVASTGARVLLAYTGFTGNYVDTCRDFIFIEDLLVT